MSEGCQALSSKTFVTKSWDSSEKNQKTLVEAIARLRPRHPDTHLVLVGPPTQPETTKAKRNGWANNDKFWEPPLVGRNIRLETN